MLENITIGADPELFIYNTDTKSVVSSIGIIPGEKGNPWTDPSWEPGYGLEIDNILAEFNIPPCTTKEDFINSIVFMKKYIRDFVKKINPSYDIRCRASYLVPEDQLQSKEAKLFGCSVDYNAYTEALKKAEVKHQGEIIEFVNTFFGGTKAIIEGTDRKIYKIHIDNLKVIGHYD